MNKNELVRAVAEASGSTIKVAESVINSTIDVIKKAVADGDSVVIPGSYKFMSVVRPGRAYPNPATGEKVWKPEHTVPVVRVSTSYTKNF